LGNGKNDGKCQIGVVPPPGTAQATSDPKVILADREAMSSALDSYFRSFIKAIDNGGGQPNGKLLQSAFDTRLSRAGHENVELAVWISLDAVMGWDFQYPTALQRTEGFVGNIREVDGVKSAGLIVDAARRSLVDAVESGDSTRVAGPIQDFWSKHPDSMPSHLGRCYPHGHKEIRDMKAAVSCQIDVLQRLALMLTGSVDPGVQARGADGAAKEEKAAVLESIDR
jgi:hypothetical protein